MDDKPDLRNPLKMVSIKEDIKDTKFKVFSDPANTSRWQSCCPNSPRWKQIIKKDIIF